MNTTTTYSYQNQVSEYASDWSLEKHNYPTLSDRQIHAVHLNEIDEVTGRDDGVYFQAMTFTEAYQFVYGYRWETEQGMPINEAIQRQWDCFFAAKRSI